MLLARVGGLERRALKLEGDHQRPAIERDDVVRGVACIGQAGQGVALPAQTRRR